jgi:hypothetical protein
VVELLRDTVTVLVDHPLLLGELKVHGSRSLMRLVGVDWEKGFAQRCAE